MWLVATKITVIEIKLYTKQNRRLLHKNGANDTTNAKLISNAGSNKMFIRITYALISVLKNVKILFIKKYFKAIKLSVIGGHVHICICFRMTLKLGVSFMQHIEHHSQQQRNPKCCGEFYISKSPFAQSLQLPNVWVCSLKTVIWAGGSTVLVLQKGSRNHGAICCEAAHTLGLLLGMEILTSSGTLLLLSSHRTTDPRH